MTGCARTDYLHADDAELSPTRSITIAVQVAGRSGGDASEAIVTAMKGPRRGTTKASALVAALLATDTGRLRAADHQHEHEHEHDPAHRIGCLDRQHQFGCYARSLDDGPDPRPAQLRCRPAERTSSRLLHRLSPDRAAATRFRVLPRDRRGPLLTPGSALHARRAQPGRHPGQHPPDDLPGRAGPTRYGRQRASPSRRKPRAWPPTETPGRSAPTNMTTSCRWSSAARSMTLGTCGQSPERRPTPRTRSRTL